MMNVGRNARPQPAAAISLNTSPLLQLKSDGTSTGSLPVNCHACRGGDVGVLQRFMMLQVGRDFWLSMLPEIVRAATDGVPDGRQLACYQRRILHAAYSYRHVESLSHQVGVAVEKLHLNRKPGIARRQLS